MIARKFFVVLFVSLLFVCPTAKATTLQITGGNLYILNSFPGYAYSSGMLLWTWGQNLSVTYERSIGSTYTQHADNYGNYWGECVSSCKALSGNNTSTSQWTSGSIVVNGGVSAGTVIATFFGSGGSYSGHAAIFKGYTRDGAGNITGIEMWDQNWYSYSGQGVFGTHTILRTGGGGVGDANSYRVVNVP